ncbi:MAG: hypothetical protein NC930_09490, partial [Candidatus Omnitrophica bacterium]|nr:hypothetical protein [Candidatus Omnitrophota bacterium]
MVGAVEKIDLHIFKEMSARTVPLPIQKDGRTVSRPASQSRAEVRQITRETNYAALFSPDSATQLPGLAFDLKQAQENNKPPFEQDALEVTFHSSQEKLRVPAQWDFSSRETGKQLTPLLVEWLEKILSEFPVLREKIAQGENIPVIVLVAGPNIQIIVPELGELVYARELEQNVPLKDLFGRPAEVQKTSAVRVVNVPGGRQFQFQYPSEARSSSSTVRLDGPMDTPAVDTARRSEARQGREVTENVMQFFAPEVMRELVTNGDVIGTPIYYHPRQEDATGKGAVVRVIFKGEFSMGRINKTGSEETRFPATRDVANKLYFKIRQITVNYDQPGHLDPVGLAVIPGSGFLLAKNYFENISPGGLILEAGEEGLTDNEIADRVREFVRGLTGAEVYYEIKVDVSPKVSVLSHEIPNEGKFLEFTKREINPALYQNLLPDALLEQSLANNFDLKSMAYSLVDEGILTTESHFTALATRPVRMPTPEEAADAKAQINRDLQQGRSPNLFIVDEGALFNFVLSHLVRALEEFDKGELFGPELTLEEREDRVRGNIIRFFEAVLGWTGLEMGRGGKLHRVSFDRAELVSRLLILLKYFSRRCPQSQSKDSQAYQLLRGITRIGENAEEASILRGWYEGMVTTRFKDWVDHLVPPSESKPSRSEARDLDHSKGRVDLKEQVDGPMDTPAVDIGTEKEVGVAIVSQGDAFRVYLSDLTAEDIVKSYLDKDQWVNSFKSSMLHHAQSRRALQNQKIKQVFDNFLFGAAKKIKNKNREEIWQWLGSAQLVKQIQKLGKDLEKLGVGKEFFDQRLFLELVQGVVGRVLTVRDTITAAAILEAAGKFEKVSEGIETLIPALSGQPQAFADLFNEAIGESEFVNWYQTKFGKMPVRLTPAVSGTGSVAEQVFQENLSRSEPVPDLTHSSVFGFSLLTSDIADGQQFLEGFEGRADGYIAVVFDRTQTKGRLLKSLPPVVERIGYDERNFLTPR